MGYIYLNKSQLVAELINRDKLLKESSTKLADTKQQQTIKVDELERKLEHQRVTIEKQDNRRFEIEELREGKKIRDRTIGDYRKQNVRLKKQNRELEKQVNSTRQDNEFRFSPMHKDLTDDICRLNRLVDECDTKEEVTNRTVDKLSDANMTLILDNKHLKDLQKDMDKQHKELNDENRRLATKCDKLSGELNNGEVLEQEMKVTYGQNKCLAEEDEGLRSDVKKAELEYKKLRYFYDEQHDKNEKLESKTEMQTQSIKTLNELNGEVREQLKDYKEMNSVLTETVAIQAVLINTGKVVGEL